MLKSRGFTLVEVVLVVLIVGILAGVVIPRIQYSTDLAKGSACNATVSRVNSTIEYAYVTDADITVYPVDAGNVDELNLGEWDKYFPDDIPALCELGQAYEIFDGRIVSHNHAIE